MKTLYTLLFSLTLCLPLVAEDVKLSGDLVTECGSSGGIPPCPKVNNSKDDSLSHYEWLSKRLEEATQVKQGMAKERFFITFQVEQGWKIKNQFQLISCPLIKVTAEFDKDGNISRISQPFLGIVAYD